jgi:hypothetical protein
MTIEFLKNLGVILSRLFVDSFQIEPVILQFHKSKTFLRSVMLLVQSHAELTALSSSLKTSSEVV